MRMPLIHPEERRHRSVENPGSTILAAYEAHPDEGGRLRFREATTGETAGFARLWSGPSLFPTESEG